MKLATTTNQFLMVMVILSNFLVGYRYADQELCVPRLPSFDRKGAGYELINLADGGVWGTRNWTPTEYDAFSFPFPWTDWFKNDPRIGLADRSQFLQSPGCDEGQYSYMRAFGREFLQVVQLNSIAAHSDDPALLQHTELEKYHVLYYSAGRTVSILQSPNGERFIGVSRSLNRSANAPTLPEGWTLKEHLLTAELQVDLVGPVSVLRLDNEDSYQGSLSEDASL